MGFHAFRMLKRPHVFMLAAWLWLTGCAGESASGKNVVAAGIPPVACLAREIAGEKYTVVTLLPPGKNPHDYAPGTKELARAGKCPLFLTAGMPFEKRLGAVFGNGTNIVDVAEKLPHRKMSGKHHHHHDDDADHENHDGDLDDPHVWLSPDLDMQMAAVICDALIRTFPGDAEIFRANCAALQREITRKKAEIAQKLASRRDRRFFVYHPAFGYFADAFQLQEIAVESGGRESDPAQLGRIIREMRNCKNPVLFVQKQFSPSAGRALQEQCRARLVEIDPLDENLFALFDTLADALEQTEK